MATTVPNGLDCRSTLGNFQRLHTPINTIPVDEHVLYTPYTPEELKMIELTVNGKRRQFTGDENMPLLWFVRDELALTGTKFGCGAGLCGACTLHVNGQAVRSCITPVSAAKGKNITTIEGLDPGGNHPVQRAWREHNVPQCGYCQGGQIMQAASLLKGNPDPSDQEIIDGMSGNICRCGTYQRIFAAVRTAAKEV